MRLDQPDLADTYSGVLPTDTLPAAPRADRPLEDLIHSVWASVVQGQPRLVLCPANHEHASAWQALLTARPNALIWNISTDSTFGTTLLPPSWRSLPSLLQQISIRQSAVRSGALSEDEALAAGGWGASGSMSFSAVTPLAPKLPDPAPPKTGHELAELERCIEEAGVPHGSTHRTLLNDVILDNLGMAASGSLFGRPAPVALLLHGTGPIGQPTLNLIRRLLDEAAGRSWPVLVVVAAGHEPEHAYLHTAAPAIDPQLLVAPHSDSQPISAAVVTPVPTPHNWQDRLLAGELDASAQGTDHERMEVLEWVVQSCQPSPDQDDITTAAWGHAARQLMRFCLQHRLDDCAAHLAAALTDADTARTITLTHEARQEALRILWWQASLPAVATLADCGLAAAGNAPDTAIERARYLEAQADVFWALGQPEDAENAYLAALQNLRTAAQTAMARRRLGRVLCKLADAEVLAGRWENAERLVSEAMSVRRQVAAATPTDLSAARLVAVTHGKLGDIEIAADRFAIAEGHLRTALAEFTDNLTRFGEQAVTLRDLSGAKLRLADLLLRLGHVEDARRLHQEALATRRTVIQTWGSRPEFVRDLGVSLERIGDFARREGKHAEAIRLYRQSLELARRVAVHHGNTWVLQRDFSVSLIRVADVVKEQGDRDEAARLYEEALAVRRQLVADQPARVELKLDLTVALERVAEVMRAMRPGGRDGRQIASELYAQAMTLYRDLVDAWGESPVLLRGGAVVMLRQADVEAALGRTSRSEELYRSAQSVFGRIIEVFGRSPGALRDLSVAIESMGDLELRLGRIDEAERLYTQSMQLRKELATDTSLAGTSQEDLATSFERLARLAMVRGNVHSAITAINDAVWLQKGVMARFGETARRNTRLKALRETQNAISLTSAK
jgi:tetratricopeptide (TPR) repeat protein